MLEQIETDKIFSLDIDVKDPLQKKLFSIIKGPIEHFLAFPRLKRAYTDIAQMSDSRPFTEKVLEKLCIFYSNDGYNPSTHNTMCLAKGDSHGYCVE